MADPTLRETLEASIATVESTATPEATSAPAPAPAPTPAPPAPSPAPAPAEEVDEPSEASGTKTPEVAGEDPTKSGEKTVEVASEVVPKIDRAPQSWKPAQKAKWDKLDPDVRAEIVRRERETTKTLSDAAEARKFASGFAEAMKPYAARFRAANVQPTQAIMALVRADHALVHAVPEDRAKMMAAMIKDYGVDINMLDQALGGETINDPMSQVERMVSQRLKPFEDLIQRQDREHQEAVQRDFQQQVHVVESMENDPKFPLFEMVREDMADIIEINLKRGRSESLSQVYNRAVQVNPEASAEAVKLSKQQRAVQANEATQRALGASLSVSGGASSMQKDVPASDLRGTLEAAFLQHSGR